MNSHQQHLLVSENTTQFWHYLLEHSIRLLQVKSSVPQDCFLSPTLNANHKSQAFNYLSLWLMGYRAEVPTTSSLHSFNMQEWLIKLRGTITHVNQLIKGYDKRCESIARWRDIQSKEGGRAQSFHAPSRYVTFLGFTKLSEPVLFDVYEGFTEHSWLTKSLPSTDSTSRPPSLPSGWEVWLKVPNDKIHMSYKN